MKQKKLKIKRLSKALCKLEKRSDGKFQFPCLKLESDYSWAIDMDNEDMDIIYYGNSIKELNEWSKGILNDR